MNIDDLNLNILLEPLNVLKNCNCCPRNCGANRFSDKLGYCKSGADFSISSICTHRGEEPPISGSKGICNVFFTNCNLQCSFCQNYQISTNIENRKTDSRPLIRVLHEITEIIDQGINILGFVSPGHFIPQMKVIISALNKLGYHPTIVYNSNGYDKVSELQKLEGIVDVYLPDLKYSNADIGLKYSDAKDYPQIAYKAIIEMYRQMGSTLITNENGYAERGLLIRHLILPGNVQNSIDVLQWIAEELSTNISISLMSQYYPTSNVCNDKQIGRSLNNTEYQNVVDAFHSFGLHNGFIQELGSNENYRPDFYKNENPFE